MHLTSLTFLYICNIAANAVYNKKLADKMKEYENLKTKFAKDLQKHKSKNNLETHFDKTFFDANKPINFLKTTDNILKAHASNALECEIIQCFLNPQKIKDSQFVVQNFIKEFYKFVGNVYKKTNLAMM